MFDNTELKINCFEQKNTLVFYFMVSSNTILEGHVSFPGFSTCLWMVWNALSKRTSNIA